MVRVTDAIALDERDIEERFVRASGPGSRLTADGVLLIDSREHRTQGQNREAARARLIALLQQAAKRPKKRRPTRPRKAAKEKRLDSKKRRGAVKDLRSGRRSCED